MTSIRLEPFHVVCFLIAGVFATCLVVYEVDRATAITAFAAASCVVAFVLGIFDRVGDDVDHANGVVIGKGAAAPPVSLDNELYTMRARAQGPGGTKHLALRRGGRLLRLVSRASAIGVRRANSASGDRAVSALEDFFMRYHWALLRADDAIAARPAGLSRPDTSDLISRTLAVLCDTRTVALNALQEITFTIPLPLAGPVTRAVAAVREETLMCLEILVDRLAQSDPVAAQVASTAWRGPIPHDPLRSRRDAAGYTHQLW